MKTDIKNAEVDYLDFLEYYLRDDSDALQWVLAYSTYVHAIDDIIDEPDKKTSQHILRTFELALVLYSHVFYRKHWNLLYPLIKMNTNTYMDSIIMENASEAWRRTAADYLRTTGNETILMCIELVHGVDIRREASMKLREISYKTHHKNDGTPC